MTRFENATRQEVEEFVKQWLIDEEYELKPYPDPNSSFNYQITKPNLQVNVGQNKDSEDNIIIVGRVPFDKDAQNMLRYLKIKREFLYELEIVFTITNIEFSLKPNTTENEFTIEDIVLLKTIYYDALTKQTLYDALSSVFNCLKLIIAKFNLLGRSSANLTQ